MRRVIITDLTRFANKDLVCTAAIDLSSGECFRPMPYLKSERCAELNIQPGAILEGHFTYQSDRKNPHIEDADYQNLKFVGPASCQQFKEILDRTMSENLTRGFGVEFERNQKHIPSNETANCSIVTIKVSPKTIWLKEDQFKPGKIKLSFIDNNYKSFNFLSITDRGFFDYAQKYQNDNKLDELQNFVSSQEEVYLRIGVGRKWSINDKDGYWLQVNGIYTFPDYHDEIRSYN